MADEQRSSSTISGTVLGTPDYLSPEQAAGMVDKIGPPTDVYGLGAVLYELLTGQPPIHGASTADTLRSVLVDEPQSLRDLVPGVPLDLEAITIKCLQKSPRLPASIWRNWMGHRESCRTCGSMWQPHSMEAQRGFT